MLKLDAQLRMPAVGLTTTTARPDFALGELRRAEQLLWRELRREATRVGAKAGTEEWPEYVGFLEWTTGKGAHAGGHRRPHIHHLVKGLDAVMRRRCGCARCRGDNVLSADTCTATPERIEPWVSELWRRFTGDAWVIECRPLRTPVGAIAYLRQHHGKPTQAPPAGFRGRRLRPSKGYYERPIDELRVLARKLAGQDRVAGAVARAIDVELMGVDAPTEWEIDRQMTVALTEGLRDLAEHPLELQINLAGRTDAEVERRELIARAAAALERLRADEPAELVRVRERAFVDPETGEVRRWAVEVIGPMTRAVA